MAAFGVDFRRARAAVCARLGFDYCHVEFKEVEEEVYTPERELVFGSLPFGWMRLFQVAWLQTPFIQQAHCAWAITGNHIGT